METVHKPTVRETDYEILATGLLAGDRGALARAITLVESNRPEHLARAQALLQKILPSTGKAFRIGVTGVPGVGKSTLIDTLGMNLTEAGHRVAVLAVDPSSSRSGGSILGDKTRMHRLANSPSAYIRPSPAAGSLGGVAAKTRESMLLCEAAGFDVILVETVGVGQSETAVASMVDIFVLFMLPGAGDALQGIKKGIIELADIIAVNKADGEGVARARAAAAELHAALTILRPTDPDWRVEVLTLSGLRNEGLDELWALIKRHRAIMQEKNRFQEKRSQQQINWMHELIQGHFRDRLAHDPAVRAALLEREVRVAKGELNPGLAAAEIARMLGLL